MEKTLEPENKRELANGGVAEYNDSIARACKMIDIHHPRNSRIGVQGMTYGYRSHSWVKRRRTVTLNDLTAVIGRRYWMLISSELLIK